MESDLPLLPDGNATLNAAEVGDDAQTPQCGSARAAVRSGVRVMHALTGLWYGGVARRCAYSGYPQGTRRKEVACRLGSSVKI